MNLVGGFQETRKKRNRIKNAMTQTITTLSFGWKITLNYELIFENRTKIDYNNETKDQCETQNPLIRMKRDRYIAKDGRSHLSGKCDDHFFHNRSILNTRFPQRSKPWLTYTKYISLPDWRITRVLRFIASSPLRYFLLREKRMRVLWQNCYSPT